MPLWRIGAGGVSGELRGGVKGEGPGTILSSEGIAFVILATRKQKLAGRRFEGRIIVSIVFETLNTQVTSILLVAFLVKLTSSKSQARSWKRSQ